MGLMKAVEKFQYPRRGYKFLHLRHLVDSPGRSTRAIADQARTIRIPGPHDRDDQHVDADPEAADPGFWPRTSVPDEIAEELQIPVERVRAVLKMAQQPISRFNLPSGDAEDTNFGDFIEDKTSESPSEITSFKPC